MLAKIIMEPVTTDWAASIVFSAERVDSLHLCLDYRKLNAVTILYSYPTTCKDDCIDSLEDETVLSTIYANSACWQIKIDERDQ